MNPDRNNRSQSAVASQLSDADECAQRLSALLDGELDAEGCKALVERLRHDEDACRKWALLNCVGDAMRSSDVASFHSDGFVARVSVALAREPTVLAPAALPQRSAVRRWLLPGAAAAAAVLIAVWLPLRQGSSPETTMAKAPAAPTTTVAAVPVPVIDRSPQLERYLAAHRELAEPTVMPHSTPYVRTSGAMLMQEGR